MNADRAARSQPELGSRVDADDVTGRLQGIEDSCPADPGEVFRPRPRIDSLRSSSASSLEAEYASTCDCASSMLTIPWVRSAMD